MSAAKPPAYRVMSGDTGKIFEGTFPTENEANAHMRSLLLGKLVKSAKVEPCTELGSERMDRYVVVWYGSTVEGGPGPRSVGRQELDGWFTAFGVRKRAAAMFELLASLNNEEDTTVGGCVLMVLR